MKSFLDNYRGLPTQWWLLTLYIIVINGTDAFTIYQSLVFSDLQHFGPDKIGILLGAFALGTCFCTLFLGGFIDKTRSLLTWLVIPRSIAGLLVLSMHIQQHFLLLCCAVFLLSINIFVGNLSIYKCIKLLVTEKQKKEAMLVLFSTFRHVGYLLSTGFAYLLFEKLGRWIMLVDGSVTIIASLFLGVILKGKLPQNSLEETSDNAPDSKPEKLSFLKAFQSNVFFFVPIILIGLIYETSLTAVVPLMMKYEGYTNYVGKFSLLEAASKGVFFFMPFVFALFKHKTFRMKTRFFLFAHVLMVALYFLFKIENGWLYALPIYASLCLMGESIFAVIFTEASEVFDNKVFGRVSGYFEFCIFVGVTASSFLTGFYIKHLEVFFGLFFVVPILSYAMIMKWYASTPKVNQSLPKET